MPFDPKLLHPDDPPLNSVGEIELPADLAALGEQLTDDAVHLARCYPSEAASGVKEMASGGRQPPEAIRAASRTPVVFVLGFSAAALSLVTLIAVGLAWYSQQQPLAQPDLIAAHSPRESAPRDEPGRPSSDLYPEPTPDASALSLQDLSGPELEAVLDLLEREPHTATASVAF